MPRVAVGISTSRCQDRWRRRVPRGVVGGHSRTDEGLNRSAGQHDGASVCVPVDVEGPA
jgi:hypothetical protein